MQRSGTVYTLVFMLVVCFVFSLLVSTSAYVLRPRQERNVVLDRRQNVLSVSGLVDSGQVLSADEIQAMFEKNIRVRIIDLETGEYVDDVDPDYSMVKAVKKDETIDLATVVETSGYGDRARATAHCAQGGGKI